MLGALVLALLAQRALEPPGRSLMVGVILYGLAAALLIWANLRGEWQLSGGRAPSWVANWEQMDFKPIIDEKGK